MINQSADFDGTLITDGIVGNSVLLQDQSPDPNRHFSAIFDKTGIFANVGSSNVNSAGVALSRSDATGILWPSTTTGGTFSFLGFSNSVAPFLPARNSHRQKHLPDLVFRPH